MLTTAGVWGKPPMGRNLHAPYRRVTVDEVTWIAAMRADPTDAGIMGRFAV